MIARNDENLLDRMIGRKIRAGESSRILVNGIGVELMNFPHGLGAPENGERAATNNYAGCYLETTM